MTEKQFKEKCRKRGLLYETREIEGNTEIRVFERGPLLGETMIAPGTAEEAIEKGLDVLWQDVEIELV